MDLADVAGTSQSTISQLERNSHMPSGEVFGKIMEALDISTEEAGIALIFEDDVEAALWNQRRLKPVTRDALILLYKRALAAETQ